MPTNLEVWENEVLLPFIWKFALIVIVVWVLAEAYQKWRPKK